MDNKLTNQKVTKKLIIFYVLEVLKKYTTNDISLTCEEIIKKVYEDFNLKIERKTAWQNVKALQELSETFPGKFPFEIEQIKRKGWKYKSEKDNVLKKNLEIIEKAIKENKKIRFKYLRYTVDKQLKKEITSFNLEKEYKIIPYFVLNDRNGKTVLVGKTDYCLYNDICNGRDAAVDEGGLLNFKAYRMTNIVTADEILPEEKEVIDKMNKDYYKKTHYYFYGDKKGDVVFKLVKEKAEEFLIDELVEDFGELVEMKEENGCYYATIHGVIKALEVWAYKFIDCVEVVSPPEVRQNVMNEVAKGLKRYEITCENKNLEKIKNRMI